MESKHESKRSGLRVHTSSDTSDVDYAKKRFGLSRSGSASSSPDSPLDDPFSDYELNEGPQSETKHGEDITPTKPAPMTNSKLPPIQAMEQPSGSAYRIPSHVFARAKSTAHVEWSTASNESLFSIHVGDSSFGRDSMFNYNHSYKQSPRNLANVPGKASESKGDEAAVETVKVDKNVTLTPSVSGHSNISDVSGSVHSFAFPILIGNSGKDGWARTDESARIGFDRSSQQQAPTPQKQPSPQPQPQQPEQPKASPPARSSWFGWFTCCTACAR